MGLLLQSKSFLLKKFCFNQNFEIRSRLHINFYIMGINLTCMQLLACILRSYFRVDTQICKMENNPDGHLLSGFRF